MCVCVVQAAACILVQAGNGWRAQHFAHATTRALQAEGVRRVAPAGACVHAGRQGMRARSRRGRVESGIVLPQQPPVYIGHRLCVKGTEPLGGTGNRRRRQSDRRGVVGSIGSKQRATRHLWCTQLLQKLLLLLNYGTLLFQKNPELSDLGVQRDTRAVLLLGALARI